MSGVALFGVVEDSVNEMGLNETHVLSGKLTKKLSGLFKAVASGDEDSIGSTILRHTQLAERETIEALLEAYKRVAESDGHKDPRGQLLYRTLNATAAAHALTPEGYNNTVGTDRDRRQQKTLVKIQEFYYAQQVLGVDENAGLRVTVAAVLLVVLLLLNVWLYFNKERIWPRPTPPPGVLEGGWGAAAGAGAGDGDYAEEL